MLNLWFYDAFLTDFFKNVPVILDANRERMYFDETFVNRTSSHMWSGKEPSWNTALNTYFGHNFPSFFRDLIFAVGYVVCILLIVAVCLQGFVLHKQNTKTSARSSRKGNASYYTKYLSKMILQTHTLTSTKTHISK